MDTPLISFIIPFYGEASRDLLRACLQSVRSQPAMRGEDYEIILATDGSHGPGGARNEGMRRAKGKYVFFIDADDYLLPDSLELPAFLYGDTSPDICTFGFVTLSGNARYRPHTVRALPAQYKHYNCGADYLQTHNIYGSVWRRFFLLSFLRRNGLEFAEDCYHQDEDFVAKAYVMAGEVVVTDKPIYAYCRREGSIIHNDALSEREKRVKDFLSCILRLQRFGQAMLFDNRRKEALRRRISFLTIDYLRQLHRNRMGFSYMLAQVHRLKREGLLPLPAGRYGTKYRLARCALNLLIWRM